MATTRVTPFQFLRSILSNRRPDPLKMLPGQGAVNLNSTQPGLFFADDTGSSLIKIGPCTVGADAPNSATGWPNAPTPTALGNTLGELWLDTTPSTPDYPGPVLKVWDGTSWIQCMPYRYANVIVADVEPSLGIHPDGTLWWNSDTGLMYVLYNDGASRQWTQVSSNTVS